MFGFTQVSLAVVELAVVAAPSASWLAGLAVAAGLGWLRLCLRLVQCLRWGFVVAVLAPVGAASWMVVAGVVVQLGPSEPLALDPLGLEGKPAPLAFGANLLAQASAP